MILTTTWRHTLASGNAGTADALWGSKSVGTALSAGKSTAAAAETQLATAGAVAASGSWGRPAPAAALPSGCTAPGAATHTHRWLLFVFPAALVIVMTCPVPRLQRTSASATKGSCTYLGCRHGLPGCHRWRLQLGAKHAAGHRAGGGSGMQLRLPGIHAAPAHALQSSAHTQGANNETIVLSNHAK